MLDDNLKLVVLKQDEQDLVDAQRGQLIWNAVKLTGRGRLGDGLVLDGASFSCMMQCSLCDAQVLQTWTNASGFPSRGSRPAQISDVRRGSTSRRELTWYKVISRVVISGLASGLAFGNPS